MIPALSPLKVEIIYEVKLSDIIVICSFKIKIQGIDHQEAQGHWILQISSSRITYNGDNVIHVIKKLYYILNFKTSEYILYTIDYISQSPIHCYRGNLKSFLKCTKFLKKKKQ